jgi:hypothetical protein
LFRYGKGIIDLYAKVSDGTFDLGVTFAGLVSGG